MFDNVEAMQAMTEIEAVDPRYYRDRYSDLSGLSDDEAIDHYGHWGRSEGRIPSPFAERATFVKQLPHDGAILEVGPFFTPLVRGANVAYLDILTADELRERAVEVGGDPAGVPETIDYIGEITTIDARFDAILSCHSIEHHPDLVTHLRGIADRLKPGGRYWLIIPDKRFCFDHFLPESTIAEVVAAYREQRKQHSVANIIAHRTLVTHNDPGQHWAENHGMAVPHDLAARVSSAMKFLDEQGNAPVDVHAWQFTPSSFATIIRTLAEAGLIDITVEQVFETPFNSLEFTAILRRT